jgi:2-polyprenyl-6-methoxyphenol hydroxylase-like FAD-dependent oxidoreductase
MSQPREVAIIGAGLSGLSLALAMNQKNIPCTVYESRPASFNIGGAVMLSPNALKILDALGVYSRVRGKGFNFETLEYRDVDEDLDQVKEIYEFGGEQKYGYKALRIYRHVLINELLAMLAEKGISLKYSMKFKRIVEETEDCVTWEWADGTQQSGHLLVGADGIHSTVRKHLYPDLSPTFIGMAGITAAVPTSQLKLPEGYHIPVTFTTKKYGAFVIAPQEIDGSEVLIGKQKRLEDRGKEEWAAVLADKQSLVEFLQQNAEEFPEIVQNAVTHIPTDKINVWPFYIVPKLDKWSSLNKRVVMLGDAAHAIPPSAGQGINQAFEDIYMFALLLAQAGKVEMQKALTFWQQYRQERIEAIMALNKQIDLRRMSSDEKTKAEMEEMNLEWLYAPDFKAVVENWLAEQAA